METENFKHLYNALNNEIKRIEPMYDRQSDYQTNSKSYYDYLAKLKKLFELLSNRIWEYDDELKKRFDEWDKNLEELPDELKRMFIEWIDDGTLARILAQLILDEYATKEEVNELLELLNSKLSENINDNTKLIKQTKEDITKLIEKTKEDIDNELLTMNNDINYFKTSVNERLNNFSNINSIEVLENITELIEKYPSGSDKIIVLKSDNHFYYYDENVWKKGNEFIQSNYKLVNNDGSMINLNFSDDWRNNPDITTLDTGFYVAYLQNENLNENYPVAKNIPKEIEGNMCTIKVYNYHIDDRVDYEITRNFTGHTFTASMNHDGTMTEWGTVLRTTESRPLQQYRLTYFGGEIPPISQAHEEITSTSLTVPITELKTGFYYGQITKDDESIDRKLPHDIIYSPYYTFNVYRNYDDRISITLHDNLSKRTWQCYSLPNAKEIIWNRLDKDTDLLEHDINFFSYKANKLSNNNFKSLVITDTHIQHEAKTNQIANINATNIEDFYKIDESLFYNDASIHLGDWIDGNFEKENSANSMVKLSREFFSKPKRFGVYGNHDFNGQWDGFSGQNGQYKYSLQRLFNHNELMTYYTPFQKDYYFVDNEDKKIRMLFLNSFDISYKLNEEGELYVDPLNTRGFGTTQIEWLLKTLNEVPKNYNVVVYTHDTFNNVFNDGQYYNGDLVRKICESYQDKSSLEVFTTGIDETSEIFDYYDIEKTHSFEQTNGKILGVISGHRHEDKSINKNGIRYISLLCARAESGNTVEKPTRNYNNVTRNAISYLEFDLPNQKINLLRYGAGIDRTFNMFE